MLDHIPELVTLIPAGQNTFDSKHVAEKMGNMANIAYGGSTLAFAINASAATVKPNYHLYSAMGNFLGPVLTDRKMTCNVHILRDTTSFATREARVTQVYPDGSTRLVITMLADFQVAERASVLTYSAKTSMPYSSPSETLPAAELYEKMFKEGRITAKELATHGTLFNTMSRYFDNHPCPEGVGAQNISSIAKNVITTQDHLTVPEKTSADWFKHRKPLQTQPENLSALVFLMDGALSFSPLTHSHMTLSDVGACSSLDFAMRVFGNEVRLDRWHVKEVKTLVGGDGRTYAEARLFDEEGNLVANMTQQSIMRSAKALL